MSRNLIPVDIPVSPNIQKFPNACDFTATSPTFCLCWISSVCCHLILQHDLFLSHISSSELEFIINLPKFKSSHETKERNNSYKVSVSYLVKIVRFTSKCAKTLNRMLSIFVPKHCLDYLCNTRSSFPNLYLKLSVFISFHFYSFF